MSDGPRDSYVRVTEADAGQRLDHLLAIRLPDLSRSQAQRLIRAGHVTVDHAAAKSSLLVSPGMYIEVRVPAPAPASPEPQALPLTVLYDDEDLVVVDKPAGMVVHPAAGHASGTLVNALLHHVRGLSGIGGTERPGIVHRLDKGTSGVMVVAKHDRAHRELARQFQDREIEKIYVALVWGKPSQGLVLDRPIGRDPRNRQRISSRTTRGRAAHTVVGSVEPLGGVSLAQVRIHTGRTHQIRVHLSEAGFPIVGDPLYGGVRKRVPTRLASVQQLDRPFLHAWHLGFHHPSTRRHMIIQASLPPDLAAIVATLRRAAPAGNSAGSEE